MDTAVIVGIFTLVGTLAGVAIGASLDYLFREKSRRKERTDLLKEETMDRLTDIGLILQNFSTHIEKLKKKPKKSEEEYLWNEFHETLEKYRISYEELNKSYFRMLRYTKKEPFKELDNIVNELKTFFDLYKKFQIEYRVSKSVVGVKQLETQIEKTSEAITHGIASLARE